MKIESVVLYVWEVYHPFEKKWVKLLNDVNWAAMPPEAEDWKARRVKMRLIRNEDYKALIKKAKYSDIRLY